MQRRAGTGVFSAHGRAFEPRRLHYFNPQPHMPEPGGKHRRSQVQLCRQCVGLVVRVIGSMVGMVSTCALTSHDPFSVAVTIFVSMTVRMFVFSFRRRCRDVAHCRNGRDAMGIHASRRKRRRCQTGSPTAPASACPALPSRGALNA